MPDIEWWDARICADGATYDTLRAAAQVGRVPKFRVQKFRPGGARLLTLFW